MAEEEQSEPIFQDACFRAKKKKGRFKIVERPQPQLEWPVADTHAHLSMLTDAPLALARCLVHGVDFVCAMVDPAEDAHTTPDHLDSWLDRAREMAPTIAGDIPFAFDGSDLSLCMGVGVHPHNAKDFDSDLEALLKSVLVDKRCAILGEIGLDYHYDLSPRDVQRDVFARQLELARSLGLPVALHVREAHDDALAILDEVGLPEAGVLLHCCSLSPEEVAPWVSRDCYIAYGGTLTFNALEEAREGSKLVPIDRLLTETDAPFMTPHPMRGMECGPQHTIFTAAKLAEVRGIEPGDERREFLKSLRENAARLLQREALPWQK